MKKRLLLFFIFFTIIASSIAIYLSLKKEAEERGPVSPELSKRQEEAPPPEVSIPEVKTKKEERRVITITTKKSISRPEKRKPVTLIKKKKEKKPIEPEQVVQLQKKKEEKPVQLKERKTFSEVKEEIHLKPLIITRYKEKKEEIEIQEIKVPSTNTIAILPFENFTDDPEALLKIMPVIKERLIKEGFKIITQGSINAFLCSKKVRGHSFITNKLIKEAGEVLGARLFLTGAVIKFNDTDNPALGLILKLIDSKTGRLIWADYHSSTGEDFRGLLMLGKIQSIDELIQVVVDRLFNSLDKDILDSQSQRRLRVAVLPFKNVSKYPEAGMIVTELFTVSLFKSGRFEPVISGDIKTLTINLKIRHRGEINYKGLNLFAKTLNVSAVITGTVLEFTEPAGGSLPPVASISARVLDPVEGKIIWYDHMRLDGDEKILAFDWGKMRSVDMVAGTIVSELVSDINHINWDKKIN